MRMSTARKVTWTIMDNTTVHGLLVFFPFGLETTISSNMVPYLLPATARRPEDASPLLGLLPAAGPVPATALVLPTVPPDHERCSDAKTGVRSYHNHHHQGKGECAKHL